MQGCADVTSETVDSSEAPLVRITNTHSIEGYVDRISVTAGESLGVSVHVPDGSSYFTYRVKRYGGSDSAGSIRPVTILTDNTRRTATRRDYNNNAAVVGAGWPVSLTLRIPSTWQSGIYALELVDPARGQSSLVTFVVRAAGLARASVVLLASTNTWQAYNFWPYDSRASALSIYSNCSGTQSSATVSFARPNPNATTESLADAECPPTGQFFNRPEHLAIGDIRIAQWLELVGQRYSVITDSDLDSAFRGDALRLDVLDPKVSPTLIIGAHNEYWTQSMYLALEAYQQRGGNVVTLGGNSMFHVTTLSSVPWQLTKQYSNPSAQTGEINWTPEEQAARIGLVTSSLGGTGICVPFGVSAPSHWSLASAGGLAFGSSLGSSGLMATLAAGSSRGGSRSFCYHTGAGAAAGWETDRAPMFPGFMRGYNRVATSPNASLPADIVFAKRASAGEIFSIGSVTIGQSLVWDALQPASVRRLTPILTTVLARFSKPSFGDFNSDGRTDLVVRDSAGSLRLYQSDGRGAFVLDAHPVINRGWSGLKHLTAAGDLDSDGRPDLLAVDSAGALRRYRSDGGGGFVQDGGTVLAQGWNAYSSLIAPGDFNGDGRSDVITRDAAGQLRLFAGDGVGGLRAGVVVDSGWNIFDLLVSPGDYDGDGNADVLARRASGDLYLYRGTGRGAFVPGGTFLSAGWDLYDVILGAGDFDGDGTCDVLARDRAGSVYLHESTSPRVRVDTGWPAYDAVVGVW